MWQLVPVTSGKLEVQVCMEGRDAIYLLYLPSLAELGLSNNKERTFSHSRLLLVMESHWKCFVCFIRVEGNMVTYRTIIQPADEDGRLKSGGRETHWEAVALVQARSDEA